MSTPIIQDGKVKSAKKTPICIYIHILCIYYSIQCVRFRCWWSGSLLFWMSKKGTERKRNDPDNLPKKKREIKSWTSRQWTGHQTSLFDGKKQNILKTVKSTNVIIQNSSNSTSKIYAENIKHPITELHSGPRWIPNTIFLLRSVRRLWSRHLPEFHITNPQGHKIHGTRISTYTYGSWWYIDM